MHMRSITVRGYQVSTVMLVSLVLLVSVVAAAATYLWASRVIPLSVDEPLAVASYPTTFSTHPGENKTLDITITNSASVNYAVLLVFRLNDTVFQESYVEFSNSTYDIAPGSNPIQGWMKVDRKAPPANLELTIDFYRE